MPNINPFDLKDLDEELTGEVCPNCGNKAGSGVSCEMCRESVEEMTTSADIATVPMGFKVDDDEVPTPEETAETGVDVTGNVKKESRKSVFSSLVEELESGFRKNSR